MNVWGTLYFNVNIDLFSDSPLASVPTIKPPLHRPLYQVLSWLSMLSYLLLHYLLMCLNPFFNRHCTCTRIITVQACPYQGNNLLVYKGRNSYSKIMSILIWFSSWWVQCIFLVSQIQICHLELLLIVWYIYSFDILLTHMFYRLIVSLIFLRQNYLKVY